MADVYIERSSTGFFGNLGGAIKGVLVGLVLFLLSFFLLWWNEGRVDLSQIAKVSKPAPAEKVDPSLEGKFVSVTGTLSSDARLEDPQYLHPVEALSLNRNVEMYAWVEKKESRTDKKVGGGSETETKYSYVLEWTSSPQKSENFKYPQGHMNPPLPVESMSWTAGAASLGAYAFDPREASLPSAQPLQLKAEMLRGPELAAEQPGVRVARSPAPRLEGNHLYVGKGTSSSPQLGDVRISFSVLRPGGKVTIFGQQAAGSKLEPYVHEGEHRVFRVLSGTRDEAIAQMAFEHKTTTWILRVIGFLMMWFGLCLFFGPLNAVLDVLPFLGSAGRTVVSLVMFPVALLLSGVTIVVSKIAHSPVALVIVLLLVVGGGIFLAKSRSKKG